MNRINYYKWAFRFAIYIFIIRIVIFFSTLNLDPLIQFNERFFLMMIYLGKISLGLFLASIISLIIGFIQNQEQNYQFWTAVILCIGFSFYLVLVELSYNSYVLF